MAFCKQCGADLNGANFCAGCGTPADGNVIVQQAAPAMNARQKTMMEADRMMAYFSPKQDLYDSVIKANEEVTKLESRSAIGWIIAAVISVVIGLFSKEVFFYIVAAPLILFFFLTSKKNKKLLATANEKLEKLSAELQQFYKGYGYCEVGLSNTYPPMLSKLYTFVEEGDASTFAEAIRCYKDEQRHIETQIKLDQLQKTSEEAVSYTRIAAVTSTLDLLLK